jgi:site-specific DNA recombinase
MTKYHVNLVTEKDGITNFSEDATKDFMSDILGASSKFYVKLLRLKVKRGNVTRANNGLFIGNLTNVFGYDYDKETKNLKINKNEAIVIRLIFDYYLKGHGFYKISRLLNMQGYKTKQGHNFESSNIQRILSHSLYCGYLYHLGRTIKGIHEPIISEEIYSKSLLQKKDNNFRNPKMNIKHLLTGFMFCENCGSRMQVTNGEKGLRQKVKTRSYACSGYFKMECDKPTYIKERLAEPYIIDEIKNRVKELDIKLKNKKVKSYFDKNKAIGIVEDKLSRTSELYAEGNINKTNKDALILKYKKEKTEIEKMPEQKYIDVSILKDLKAQDLFEDLTFEEKRKVLSILIHKIMITSGKKSVRFFERINIIWNEL